MEARTTLPRRVNFTLRAVCLLGIVLITAVAVSLLLIRSKGTDPAATVSGPPRLAYFDFASTADTLWLIDPKDPAKKEKRFTVSHGKDFGVIPSPSADGGAFVFNALPPQTKAPGPDAPADLWLYRSGLARPRLLTKGVDLLVRPVWSVDGQSVVVRRSRAPSDSQPGESILLKVDLQSGAERPLASSATAALFPIAFTPDGSRFYYAQIQADGTDLYAIAVATGANVRVARLADGLTRDWTLSPNGERLAYLAVAFDAQGVSSRAFVRDLSTGETVPVDTEGADAFSPVWTSDGGLVIGQLAAGQDGAGLVRVGDESNLPGPEHGFDVPVAIDGATGGIVARSFEGASAMSAGASRLTLIAPDGTRSQIASGEVTFLGWIKP